MLEKLNYKRLFSSGKEKTMNKKEREDKFYKLYDELADLVETCGILDYYDYDKIKFHSVYIWTKAIDPNDMDTWGENLFDICSDEIVFYAEDHIIIEEAKPAIKKIQEQLLKIENLYKQ